MRLVFQGDPFNTNATAISEADLKAQQQWASTGTISVEYLRHTLGDQTQAVEVGRVVPRDPKAEPK